MRIISGQRRSGKTAKLIQLAADCNGYIVCADHRRACSIRDLAGVLGLQVNFPLTFQEFLSDRWHGINCAPLWIDDADALLSLLSRGTRIGAATFAEDMVEVPE